MKIKIELEIDTEVEQDLNTVQELIDKLAELKETLDDDRVFSSTKENRRAI
jgi:hypothetical protein|tara:strand:- start:474 stop:626 length:153 start_codon:yes stop_codon:yes gene_type:complete